MFWWVLGLYVAYVFVEGFIEGWNERRLGPQPQPEVDLPLVQVYDVRPPVHCEQPVPLRVGHKAQPRPAPLLLAYRPDDGRPQDEPR